jgi:hypothetical protein
VLAHSGKDDRRSLLGDGGSGDDSDDGSDDDSSDEDSDTQVQVQVHSMATTCHNLCNKAYFWSHAMALISVDHMLCML